VEGVSEPVNWQPYLEAKKTALREYVGLPEGGIVITAGDCRPPWWLLLFSPRERWFWRHRRCETARRRGPGYEIFECCTWTCMRTRSRWTDYFPA
jgi:hypothetical protein